MKIQYKDHIIQIDAADLPTLRAHNWIYQPRGAKNGHFLIRHVNGTTERLHREIMNAPHGNYIEFLDGDSLNLSRKNMRLYDGTVLNTKMYKGRSSTGYHGVLEVRYFRGRLRMGQTIHLTRCCKTAKEAAREYDKMSKRLRGEFAILNFKE